MLAVCLLAVGALALVGLGVEDRLRQTSLRIGGSESAVGSELESRTFGESIPVAVLLEGPAEQLDRQGPELIRELRRLGGVRTLSPWSKGIDLEGLRPRPGAALIVADFERPPDAAPQVATDARETIDTAIRPPVEAFLSGYAVIGRGLEEESIEATQRAELIAGPVLLAVLLFVFRTPLAAAIPLLIGGATVAAGRGLIAVLAEFVKVDALAVSVASMMGLALGVDYALLLVSRFREELAHGDEARAAARATSATAGRTIIFAGLTVGVAMAVAVLTAPGDLLVSISAAVVLVVLLAAAIAVLAGPAILVLAGSRINRWAIGSIAAGAAAGAGVSGLLRRVLREPVVATIAVGGLLLVLAVPVAGLETGAPSVAQLPEDSEVRRDFEQIEAEVGPGWTAPYIVVATADEGPVTREKRMRKLERWQDDVARSRRVRAVVGPAAVAERIEPLTGASDELANADRRLARAERGLERLSTGLDRAVDGVDELRAGLAEASQGSAELAAGSARARAGAAELAGGLRSAAAGAERASRAIAAFGGGAEQLAAGAGRLARGAGMLRGGAGRLGDGLATARKRVADEALPGAQRLAEELKEGADELERLREPAQVAEAELEQALGALEGMTVGKTDPRYLEALESVARAGGAVSGRNPITGAALEPGYEGIDAELASAVGGLDRAARGADRLARGLDELVSGLDELRDGAAELQAEIGRLESGAERLAEGARRYAAAPDRLLAGADRLAEGLGTLAAGADRLAAGLAELESGNARLADGLEGGVRRSQPLRSGLAGAADEVEPYEARLSSMGDRLERLQRRSPGLFDSGYFFLAGIEGSPPDQARRASETVNVEQGGGAARFLVISDLAPTSEDAADLRDRLARDADELAADFGGRAAVTGGASQIVDYDRITASQLPVLAASLVIVTFLLLVLILRALLLPLIAVILNVLTVAAAFGVLTFIYQVLPGAPLGGPGYIESVTAAGIFGIVFALSIDYEVFLLTRMREGYLESGDNDRAIMHGLARTATVITGAAAIMGAVFLAFATADVSSIQAFGIGLAVAVLLDATIVRLVLLPALMRLFGDRTWWIPSWLDRLLPNFDPEPARER